MNHPETPDAQGHLAAPSGQAVPPSTPGGQPQATVVDAAENRWHGDMMILTALADSDFVNGQEREVLTRWLEAASPPAPPATTVGEPVAWRWWPSDWWGCWVVTTDKAQAEDAAQFLKVEPLYTAPAPPATVEGPRLRMERINKSTSVHWWNKAAGIRMPSPELYAAGDAVLCWVNEGDLCALTYPAPPKAAPPATDREAAEILAELVAAHRSSEHETTARTHGSSHEAALARIDAKNVLHAAWTRARQWAEKRAATPEQSNGLKVKE